MNNTLKKALIGAGIALGVVALVFGGLTLYKALSRKPVDVYPVAYLSTQNWDYSTVTYGTVSSDGIQKVMLGDKHKVLEVLVQEGDKVSVGDPLLALDANLIGLDVKKAEIAKGKAELAVQQAKAELATLNSLSPHTSVLITPENTVVYVPHPTPYIIMGAGLKGDPFIVLWGDGDIFNPTYIAQLVAEYKQNAETNAALPPEGSQPSEPAGEGTPVEGEGAGAGGSAATRVEDDGNMYVNLITREKDALNAPIINRWGIMVALDAAGATAGFSFYVPVIPASVEEYTEIPQPYNEESGSFYSAAELAQARAEKRREVARLEIEYGLAKIAYETVLQESSDGYIRATVDGVVTQILDAEEAKREGVPVLTVSAGGGYTVTGTLSEFDRETVMVGQTVSLMVYDWMRGGEFTYEGEIVAISDYPTSGSNYGSGNNNASYYPFTVFVDGSVDISPEAYVEISYGTTAPGDNFYVMNAFIRTEGGNSFVYVLGEGDKLEKRYITTGGDLWGSYTQVISGLTEADYIAFPYGNDVVDGAKTKVQEDMSKLYQGIGY